MVLLGSTGSIGVSASKVIETFGIRVEAMSCGSNISLFNSQVRQFNPDYVCIMRREDAARLDFPIDRVFFDPEDMLESCKSDVVLNAIVGFAGLGASLKTQSLNKKLLLANKESLVVAGNLLDSAGVVPIDSEHFSLWYLLSKSGRAKRLFITASGGALRDFSVEQMRRVTLNDVLRHPNWNMGRKITIDSANMVNKLYEVLEAYHLFGSKNIFGVIERSSTVHSLVELEDGCINANLSVPDMTLPISYAINRYIPQDDSFNVKLQAMLGRKLDIRDLLRIDFREIDSDLYPVWTCKDMILESPHLGAVLNMSNEFASDLFLEGSISFPDISRCVVSCLYKFRDISPADSVESLLAMRTEIHDFLSSIV